MASWLARAHAIAARPGAADDPARRAATPQQADELQKLIALVLTDTDDAERAEVLNVACADPDSALECFRGLAADKENNTH